MTKPYTISAYTTARNAIEMGYPLVEAITSVLPFSNEVCVLDSSDGRDSTSEVIADLCVKYPTKLKVKHVTLDWQAPNHGILDGYTKQLARSMCAGTYLWQFDCVIPGTMIMTIEGEKPIETIRRGELVLTHKGRFRPVLRAIERGNDSYSLYCIRRGIADNRPLYLTGNHPILIADTQNGFETRWHRLDDGPLTPRDGFVFPKLLTASTPYQYDLTISDQRRARKAVSVTATKELGFLVGLYLGDGHASFDKGRLQYTVLSLSEYQQPIIDRVTAYVKAAFGIAHVSVFHYPEKHYRRMQIGNRGFAEFMHMLCGTGARHKKLHSSIYEWPNEAIEGLLEGLYQSDGMDYRGGVSITSVNGQMLTQVRTLLTKIGVYASFAVHSLKPNSYVPVESEAYLLRITGLQVNKLGFLTPRGKRQFFHESEQGFVTPSDAFKTSIKGVAYVGKLYNLEVGEDNSYIANGMALHNCDEIVHESHVDLIPKVIEDAGTGWHTNPILNLPVVEFWGDKGKVRCDVNLWKWRLSLNTPNLVHGIPKGLDWKDPVSGLMYAKHGTDTCDYINRVTRERVPSMHFIPEEVEKLRQTAVYNGRAIPALSQWFNSTLNVLPGVFHYSWYNIERKINQYKLFWTGFWKAMYNENRDERTNPFFPGKLWSEVTPSMIREKALELEQGCAGWVFHQPWDGSATNAIKVAMEHPAIIKTWLDSNRVAL